jgi:hypothetical protein
MGAFLLNMLSKILVGIFLFGLVGSAIVVVITFIEDGKVMFERDEPTTSKAKEAEPITEHARVREAF